MKCWGGVCWVLAFAARELLTNVIPAQAGIWMSGFPKIPACAGMTLTRVPLALLFQKNTTLHVIRVGELVK